MESLGWTEVIVGTIVAFTSPFVLYALWSGLMDLLTGRSDQPRYR